MYPPCIGLGCVTPYPEPQGVHSFPTDGFKTTDLRHNPPRRLDPYGQETYGQGGPMGRGPLWAGEPYGQGSPMGRGALWAGEFYGQEAPPPVLS